MQICNIIRIRKLVVRNNNQGFNSILIVFLRIVNNNLIWLYNKINELIFKTIGQRNIRAFSLKNVKSSRRFILKTPWLQWLRAGIQSLS
jgi:hypothetical protein